MIFLETKYTRAHKIGSGSRTRAGKAVHNSSDCS
jgi:hypothetical protein